MHGLCGRCSCGNDSRRGIPTPHIVRAVTIYNLNIGHVCRTLADDPLALPNATDHDDGPRGGVVFLWPTPTTYKHHPQTHCAQFRLRAH